AEDKKDGPAGTWAKKDGEMKIEFADKGVLKLRPHGDNLKFVIVCKYTADKGVVKAEITELDAPEEIKEKAKEVVPVGLKFQFKYTVKNDVAMLEEVSGDKTDSLKSHLEGDYEKK